jgi:hypothetical protein
MHEVQWNSATRLALRSLNAEQRALVLVILRDHAARLQRSPQLAMRSALREMAGGPLTDLAESIGENASSMMAAVGAGKRGERANEIRAKLELALGLPEGCILQVGGPN